jgi:hypothetical protein
MKQYIDPKNLSQKQAKHNNNFAVGDIIQIDPPLYDTQCIFLVTDVKSEIHKHLCIYGLMHLATGMVDTMSFDTAHRRYKRIA